MIKCNIYQGKNEDGTPNNSGITSFDTSREITDVYEKEGKLRNIEDIKRRYDRQIARIEALLDISEDMIESDGAVMAQPSQTPNKKAARFSFDELNIPPGAVLSWYNDPTIYCEVIDDHFVVFNGEQTTLSKIAKDKVGYNVDGALYFVYKGKTISQIRKAIGLENVDE